MKLSGKLLLLLSLLILTGFACFNTNAHSNDVNLPDRLNRFGLDLTRQLNEETEDNLFLSAPSVSFALSLAAHGAEDKTRTEIAQLLNVEDLPETEFNQLSRELLDSLLAADTGVELHVANSLWLQENFPFLENYVERSQEFYDAKVETADFLDPETARRINDWVRRQTQDKIEKIADEDAIRELIAMLFNAIYFDGQWTEEFDPDLTQPEPFYPADADPDTVPTMQREDDFAYLDKEDFQAVSLPYGEGRFSMDLYLPDADTPAEQFVKSITYEKLQTWQEDMREQEVEVKLPHFEIEYEKELREILREMGMRQAFERYDANFGRMVDLEELTENVFIDFVKHKSYVEVDERGTEAAAVTGIGVGVTAVQPEPPTIHFDRPFFFLIRDHQTGLHLFTGLVTDPTQ